MNEVTEKLNMKIEKKTMADLEEIWNFPSCDKWYSIIFFCRIRIHKKYWDAIRKRFSDDEEIKKIAAKQNIKIDELYMKFVSFANDSMFHDKIIMDCLNVEISFPSYFNDVDIDEDEIEKYVKFEFEIKEDFINSLFDSFISENKEK